MLLQITLVANEDNRDLLGGLDLLVPELGVVEANLSCKVGAQDHCIQWLEIRWNNGAHSLLSSSVKHFNFNGLRIIDL